MTCKLFKIQFLVSLAVLVLVACGSDSDNGANANVGETQAETVYGLGECEITIEGVVKRVVSENRYYTCQKGTWVSDIPKKTNDDNGSLFDGGDSGDGNGVSLDGDSGDGNDGSNSSVGTDNSDANTNDVITDTFIDARDGKTYRTVKIDSQTWMAENLNYETEGSYCYKDSLIYCAQYGRLYTWYAAMDTMGRWSSNAKGCYDIDNGCLPTYPVRGICPEGWHLPNRAEWEILIVAVGGSVDGSANMAGTKLKSIDGWAYDEEDEKNGNGTDSYSFMAFPAGHCYERKSKSYTCDDEDDKGKNAYFWSSLFDSSSVGWAMGLSYKSGTASMVGLFFEEGVSVRCLKD